MESDSREIANSAPQWLARGAPFTADEITGLFEHGSALLRNNPYALVGPKNTQRARRSDWKVFLAFCQERGFLGLPAEPPVVAAFLETMSTPIGPTPPRSMSSIPARSPGICAPRRCSPWRTRRWLVAPNWSHSPWSGFRSIRKGRA